MKTYFSSIFLFLAIISCDKTTDPFISKPNKKDTLTQYIRFDTSDISLRINSWFSSHLIQMGETNLKLDTTIKNKEVYRMLVLPTFKTPYIIRIEFNNDLKEVYCTEKRCDTINLITIVYKNTYGSGGYGGGNLKTSLKVNLPETDSTILQAINSFKKSINNLGFWEEPIDKEDGGADGTMVIIEGIRNGKYHIIYRHIIGLPYRQGEGEYYSRDFKYKEVVSLCQSIADFSNFKDWQKDIDNRELEIRKKYRR